MLVEKIDKDIKNAMLSKEKDKLEALRAIKSALLLMKTQESGVVITDDMEIKLLQKLVKQRRESADIYKSQNREDLANVELLQANVIETYLPEKLSTDELKLILIDIINELGATSIKDMGKVIGVANKKFAGQADGKTIAEMVKQIMNI